jgi:hypothetical protein
VDPDGLVAYLASENIISISQLSEKQEKKIIKNHFQRNKSFFEMFQKFMLSYQDSGSSDSDDSNPLINPITTPMVTPS